MHVMCDVKKFRPTIGRVRGVLEEPEFAPIDEQLQSGLLSQSVIKA